MRDPQVVGMPCVLMTSFTAPDAGQRRERVTGGDGGVDPVRLGIGAFG